MSFEENGISASEVDEYVESGRQPMAYNMTVYYLSLSVNKAQPSKATAEWKGSKEEKLEKIMIQKWIALYPNGQEAWSEYRRTGYPKLHEVISNLSNNEVDTYTGIRRMRFPTNKATSQEELENLEKARKLLRGGMDKAGTRLWWDNKK